MDQGEEQTVEITYPELWRLTQTQAYVCDRLGSHTRYSFKDCTIYEHPKPDGSGTFLMKIEHGGEDETHRPRPQEDKVTR